MFSPLLLEEHAQIVIRERMQQAHRDALVSQATSGAPKRLRATAIAARVRLAEALRFVACRLDPCVVAEPQPRLLIARSR